MQIIVIPLRMILTAYCFFQFAVQVLWLGKWRMLRLLKSNGDPVSKRRQALFSAHRHVVIYLNTLSFLRLIKFETIGSPDPVPCIVVANHPGLLDFIVFLRDYPYAICMYKPQSLNNPVLSAFVQVAGYIKGMSGQKGDNKRIIAECGAGLKEGHHVIIFPEGTRSPGAGSMNKFRALAFHAAIKNKVAIQPVSIRCEPLFLGKNQRWASFSKNRNRLTIEYLPVIHVDSLADNQQSAYGLQQAARTAIQQSLDNHLSQNSKQEK